MRQPSPSDDILPFGTITRDSLDQSDDVLYSTRVETGISEAVIRQISTANQEPEWMLAFRLRSFQIFQSSRLPSWWPPLDALDLGAISYYARAEGTRNTHTWDDVPESIKQTFTRLWIPEAEQKILGWVWAQYDSEVVYHSLRDELASQGVIFQDMSVALHEHEALVREHFMRLVPPTDHIFAALHGAVWSGGTFLYIPRWVVVEEPLQAYFRMNLQGWWQFEHTLIILEDEAQVHYIEWCSAPKYGTSSLHAGCVEVFVWKNAHMRYSSVENWSIDTYNLNTKRAIIDDEGSIEWVGWNLGSGVTMLYPCSILKWKYSHAEHLGISFANSGQNTDTGAKVIHLGECSTSEVISKSISKWWGISTYRWLVDVRHSARGAVSKIDCDGLILDDRSVSNTIPDIRVSAPDVTLAHEASVGKINDLHLFYLMSRWISEKQAKTLLVNGFLSWLVKELPLEYAAELNVLISMEIEGWF